MSPTSNESVMDLRRQSDTMPNVRAALEVAEREALAGVPAELLLRRLRAARHLVDAAAGAVRTMTADARRLAVLRLLVGEDGR